MLGENMPFVLMLGEFYYNVVKTIKNVFFSEGFLKMSNSYEVSFLGAILSYFLLLALLQDCFFRPWMITYLSSFMMIISVWSPSGTSP